MLYTTPIFWGDKVTHSEVLADKDILQFVTNGRVDPSRVTKLWLIIVTQYNSCPGCQAHVSTSSAQIAAKLSLQVISELCQVTKFINAYNPSTWVAPQSSKDITCPLP